MQDSQIPTKFAVAWGSSAGGAYIRSIPTASQIGINNGYASFHDGFVPLNALPTTSGGVPPFIQDFNGIFNQLTAWGQWYNAGGPITYDNTFQGTVGGYPKGSIVASATTFGLYWMCLVDNNTTNPDTGGANWVGYYPTSGGNNYWVDTGAVNALVITPQPPFTSYFNGMRFFVLPAFTNTGATTIAVNGLSSIPIINPITGTGLSANEITAGSIVSLIYYNGSFQYLNAPTGAGPCTAADIWAGSDGTRFANAAAMKNAMVPQTLTSASTVAWNLNNGMNAVIPLATNATMGVPTNLQQGATMALAVQQAGSGNTLAFPTAFDFGSVGAPALSVAGGKIDFVWCYVWDAITPIIKCTFWKSA